MPAETHASAEAGRLIRNRAIELGFEEVGIAALEPLEAREHFEAWLAADFHGEMTWLASEAHRERRADPARILPRVRSVVCVALCHDPARDEPRDARLGRIARYASGDDYHAVMKEKLAELQRYVEAEALPGSRALAYADTGAILERGWAERAGLGWIGKHSGLISTRSGSWFVLGELLIDREIEPDPPLEREHCGSCTRCLDACPTHAIVAPYRVDARLCISYLTIEQRGAVPLELRPLVGDWIFGCDVCQDVCPWNRFAPPAREARLHARTLQGWTLERFLELDDAAFAALFAGSAIRRAGRDGFLRNVCIALGNRGRENAGARGDATLACLESALTTDASALVRAHAAWALGEIAGAAERRGEHASAARVRGTLATAARFEADGAARVEAREALSRGNDAPAAGYDARP